jgi:hypothetical protein
MGRILDKSQDMDDKNGINMNNNNNNNNNNIIIIIIIIAIIMTTIVVDYIDNI